MLNPSGDSPELVALALLERIAHSEGRSFEAKPQQGAAADRQQILDTYRDCLAIVKGRGVDAVASQRQVA
jgi:hypothetical protein